jgi:hypothetical protein
MRILIVVGIVVTFLNPLVGGIIAAGVWVYLFRVVRKRKTGARADAVKPEIPGGQLKRLKTCLIVAGCAFPVFVAAAVAHNVLHGRTGMEESTFFFIALGALLVFIAPTAIGLAIVLRARQIIT